MIDIGLYFIVIRRLGKISHYADRISQGEMDLEQPNFDFLIEINKTIAEGLSDAP